MDYICLALLGKYVVDSQAKASMSSMWWIAKQSMWCIKHISLALKPKYPPHISAPPSAPPPHISAPPSMYAPHISAPPSARPGCAPPSPLPRPPLPLNQSKADMASTPRTFAGDILVGAEVFVVEQQTEEHLPSPPHPTPPHGMQRWNQRGRCSTRHKRGAKGRDHVAAVHSEAIDLGFSLGGGEGETM